MSMHILFEVLILKKKSIIAFFAFLTILLYLFYSSKDEVPLHTIQKKVEFLENEIKSLKELITKQTPDLTKQVKTLINESLQVYDADKTGIQDYALLDMGASILDTPNTIAAPLVEYELCGFMIYAEYSQPTKLLQPDIIPGQCFAFVGSWGRVQIRLSQRIIIKAVTMVHAHKAIVGHEIRSAPRFFVVYGLYDERNNTLVELGVFNYSIDGAARQTFSIPKEKQFRAFDKVELRILNNHGRVDFTCVYRFSVHGEPKPEKGD